MFPLIACHKIFDAVLVIERIYEQNRYGHENQLIMNEFTRVLLTFKKILCIYYALTIGSAIIGTIILNFFICEYVYAVPIYLPGVPIDTADGFELNIIWQSISLVYAGLAYLFFDASYALLMLHVLLMINILSNKVRIISEMASEKQPSQTELFDRIKNVIFLHNELRS